VDATVLVLIIVAVVLLVAVVAMGVMLAKRRRSEQLQKQFGPEYERQVMETGDRKAAESDLQARRQRRDELDIRDLDNEERSRFQHEWNAVQRGFVDNPERALDGADALVVSVMKVRGYPVGDFDRRAEDLSVDHADVVRHYRDARAVRDASARSGASDNGSGVDTEQQRHALTSYRSLVEALLGSLPADHADPGTGRNADRNDTSTPMHTTKTDAHRPTQEPTR
jgi:FtsZ-interacting cell division protein ZipA